MKLIIDNQLKNKINIIEDYILYPIAKIVCYQLFKDIIVSF